MKVIRIFKYAVVADQIRKLINNGTFPPGTALKSEDELAYEYDVSRITIKKALSILVEEDLVCRVKGQGSFVKDAYKKSNYALVMSLNFGTNSTALEIIAGVQQFFTANNGRTFIEFVDGSLENEKSTVSRLLLQSMDGILLHVNHHDEIRAMLKSFEDKSHCPVVLIDRYDFDAPCNAVISNHQDGGYLTCEYLYENGHRNIAVVHEAPRLTSEVEMLNGCRAFLAKHQLDCHVYENGCVPDASLLKMIKAKNITALLCANDTVATIAIDYLRANGLSVPRDVSVIGFADMQPLAAQYNLTTVKQNFRNMGLEAAKLTAELKERGIRGYKKVILPTELVERGTVKKMAR